MQAKQLPAAHLHHVHLFASDIDFTVKWYCENLGASVCFDGEFGGARNVFLELGSGRLNIYDQPPRPGLGGAVHHIGIQTDDLRALHQRLLESGIEFRSGIREFGSWRYIMCPAPDNTLLELFEIDIESMPAELQRFFNPFAS